MWETSSENLLNSHSDVALYNVIFIEGEAKNYFYQPFLYTPLFRRSPGCLMRCWDWSCCPLDSVQGPPPHLALRWIPVPARALLWGWKRHPALLYYPSLVLTLEVALYSLHSDISTIILAL